MSVTKKEDATVALRVEPEMLCKMRRAMKGDYRTVSEYVRDVIRRDLEERGEAKEQAKEDAA